MSFSKPERAKRATMSVIRLCCAALIPMCAASASAADAPKKYTETVTTKSGAKISFDMAMVPGGSFLMGSPDGEAGRKPHEGPQLKVRLDPFYLCTMETTMELFLAYYAETGTGKKDVAEGEAPQSSAPPVPAGTDAVTGPTPVYGDLSMGFDKTHPAIGMTWHNATTFCQWLSTKTGKKYRLPTEAEWEFAARDGNAGPFGDCKSPSELPDVAWFDSNSDRMPHPCGKKKPNSYGLYDMRGNVWEWVHDFYSPTAYQDAGPDKEIANPTGPKDGKVHVARGGCYDSAEAELRSAFRGFEENWWRMNDPQIPKSKWWLPQMDIIGFRVARSAD